MKEYYANAYTFNAIVQVVEEVFFIILLQLLDNIIMRTKRDRLV